MDHPEFEFLFDMVVDGGEPVPLGQTPYGDVTFQHAVGGTVEGPRIKGKILPVGGDRAVTRADGTGEINVQVLIRTDDGHNILMAYRGLVRPLKGPPGFYWRTAPFFEAASGPYSWLNGLVAVGLGKLDGNTLTYKVFALL